jgi:hypothetical protein
LPPLEVDLERREVRVPARFVNPSRQIEVFACHHSGPSHETVLEFQVTGLDLVKALRAIGCRFVDDWSAASPGDFLRNQGDRVLVLVRWRSNGEEKELPAEALLVDGPTEYPSFVRGFSFSAWSGSLGAAEATRAGEDTKAASGPEPAVDPADPEAAPRSGSHADTGADSAEREPAATKPAPGPLGAAVEITLGGSPRQRAVYSLLSHPTTLRGVRAAPGEEEARALEPWIWPPAVNLAVVQDLDRLVDDGVAAVLILRPLRSEQALVEYVRSLAAARGLERQLPLYAAIEPLAKEIDALKADYRSIAAEIGRVIDTDLSSLPASARAVLALRADALRRLGKWCSARVQQLYFEVYLKEEEFRLSELNVASTLEPALLDAAMTMVSAGLKFECALAAKEVELERKNLDEVRVRHEMAALGIERERGLREADLREVQRRRAELAADAEYLHRLFTEDQRRLDAALRAADARRDLLRASLDDLGLRLDGAAVGSGRAAAVAKRWEAGLQALRVVRLEELELELDESLRWEEGDAESGIPDREETAKRRIEELRREKKQIAATLEAARAELERLKR